MKGEGGLRGVGRVFWVSGDVGRSGGRSTGVRTCRGSRVVTWQWGAVRVGQAASRPSPRIKASGRVSGISSEGWWYLPWS